MSPSELITFMTDSKGLRKIDSPFLPWVFPTEGPWMAFVHMIVHMIVEEQKVRDVFFEGSNSCSQLRTRHPSFDPLMFRCRPCLYKILTTRPDPCSLTRCLTLFEIKQGIKMMKDLNERITRGSFLKNICFWGKDLSTKREVKPEETQRQLQHNLNTTSRPGVVNRSSTESRLK